MRFQEGYSRCSSRSQCLSANPSALLFPPQSAIFTGFPMSSSALWRYFSTTTLASLPTTASRSAEPSSSSSSSGSDVPARRCRGGGGGGGGLRGNMAQRHEPRGPKPGSALLLDRRPPTGLAEKGEGIKKIMEVGHGGRGRLATGVRPRPPRRSCATTRRGGALRSGPRRTRGRRGATVAGTQAYPLCELTYSVEENRLGGRRDQERSVLCCCV